jgi:hypothetical protein
MYLAFALAAAAAPGGALAAGATFFDNTFPPANYSSAGTYTTNGGTISSSTCPTCGDPSGPALQFVETYTSSNSAVTDEALLNSAWTYDPSTQGAISGVGASVEKDLLLTEGGDGSIASGFHPVILQGGDLYIASLSGLTYTTPSGPFTTDYATISGGLSSADFTLFDFGTGSYGTGSPNFTASGGPMTFGIAQFGNVDFATTATVDYDDLKYVLGVPEPATWAMLLVGVGMIGGGLRTARRKAGVALTAA